MQLRICDPQGTELMRRFIVWGDGDLRLSAPESSPGRLIAEGECLLAASSNSAEVGGERYGTAVCYSRSGTCDSQASALTAQQQRVLDLAATGMTDREIGRSLYVAESTVRFHIQNLKVKLRVRTKTQLVAKAIRMGLAIADAEPPQVLAEVGTSS